MAIAIVLTLLVVGSVLFHLLSPWYFTPIASNWGAMDQTISLTFWVTGIVFISVNLFVVFCIIRFRQKKGSKAAYEPENTKLEWWLVGLTTLGIASMLTPGLFVWANFVNVPQDAAIVEAVGKQWHWSYRFPGQDGKLGTTDAKYINDQNPFGINPNDPSGKDDILISHPDLHLPIGKSVKVLLRSVDVLHNFAVPQFRAKMDLVPGTLTYIWLTPTREGAFDLLCNELCGVGHYVMRGKVVVQPEAEFTTWLSRFPTYAQTQLEQKGDLQLGKASYAVCAACHGAQAEGNQALNAPKLNGQGEWYLRRQLQNYKIGARGTHDLDVFGKMMAPMAATLPDAAAVTNVSAYINSLPDTRAPAMIKGNAGKGKDLFNATCSVCHGATGMGVQATNAPRLQSMSDWYLVTQLNNFKKGIRGSDPKDMHGPQMSTVAAFLIDDQIINDLVTYINTLR
jgi:cytochrome c oxidase subunit 2